MSKIERFVRYCLLGFTSILLLSGCVAIGKSTIHSPSADNGYPVRHFHMHGGPTRKSPPAAIILYSVSDSVEIRVSARELKWKPCLAGPIIPIFPAFLIPGKNRYKDEPGMLEIRLDVFARQKVEVMPDSLTVIYEDTCFAPYRAERKRARSYGAFDHLVIQANEGEWYDPEYPYFYFEPPNELRFFFRIDAMEAKTFRLLPDCFFVDSRRLTFPDVIFERKKQTWVFMGP